VSKLARKVDALIEEHRPSLLSKIKAANETWAASMAAVTALPEGSAAPEDRAARAAAQTLANQLVAEGTQALVDLARTTGFRERWVAAFNPDHTDDPTVYRALREANIPLHDPNGWYLFLDDERDISYVGLTPKDGVVVCRSSREAVTECKNRGGPPSLMYLDHDLGLLFPETGLLSRGVDTTMRFLHWATGQYPSWDFDYDVHSMNPEGAKNIRAFLDSFLRSR